MISDELKKLLDKLKVKTPSDNFITNEIEKHKVDCEITDILPYSEFKQKFYGHLLTDEKNEMKFRISSHSFFNGNYHFTVFHDKYERYVTVDLKYLNSKQKFEDMVEYFKKVLNKSNNKVLIEIDYKACYYSWIQLFSNYFRINILMFDEDTPFKDSNTLHNNELNVIQNEDNSHIYYSETVEVHQVDKTKKTKLVNSLRKRKQIYRILKEK